MGNRGYPTVISRGATVAPPHRGGAIRPPLPKVQEAGPRPFQDYPMQDWPHVRRRKGSDVPLIKRLREPARIAWRIGRRLNRLENAINLIEFIVDRYKQTGPGELVEVPNGWEKCSDFADCGITPEGQYYTGANGCGSSYPWNRGCLPGQALTPDDFFALGTPPPTGVDQIIWCTGPVGDRTTNVAKWNRGVGTTIGTAPEYVASTVRLMETSAVSIVETIDSFSLPIGVPTMSPQALSWRRMLRSPRSDRDPNEQRQVGNYTSDDVRVRTDGQLDPVVQNWPDTLVATVPAFGPPAISPPHSVAPHRPGPPRKGTKEKKLVAAATGALKTGLNFVTEAKDVVDAVYLGLPPELRKRGLSPQAKVAEVYKNFDMLNASEVVKALLLNQLEDRIYGGIGKKMGEANRRIGRGYGFRFQAGLGPAL